MLDRNTIQTALGKCQQRQLMWGNSGKLILGVSLAINVSAYEPTLGILSSWQATDQIVCIEGKVGSATFWFHQ